MKIDITRKARKQFLKLSPNLKKQAEKQFNFLVKDFRYPSLNTKKYDEKNNIYQARINDDYRFYFNVENDVYMILLILKHPK